MTTTTYLAQSVEASRLRYLEEREDFFYKSSQAEWRALEVSNAISGWAPELSAHYLGADKFIVTALEGGTFDAAFHLDRIKEFTTKKLLTPSVLYVRCSPPPEFRSDAERFVLEQVLIAFLPF